MSYFSPLINKSPSYWHVVNSLNVWNCRKVWSTKNSFGPAEVYKVPVQMTTRSQVPLLNSGHVIFFEMCLCHKIAEILPASAIVN